MVRFACLALLLSLSGLFACLRAVEPVELIEQPDDILEMTDGRRIPGTLVEIRQDDGTVHFKLLANGEEKSYLLGMYKKVLSRRRAPLVVTEAVNQDLKEGNSRHLIKALQWGVEKGAKDAVITAAGKALNKTPADREVLAVIVPLWREKQDWTALEAAARAGLAADRNWTEGDELVVESLLQQKKLDETEAYAKAWLEKSPTALRPNLICAAAFERAGNMRAARECYRKAWQIGKSDEGALGFARTALITGQYTESITAATSLASGPMAVEAKVYLGAASVAAGDVAAAKAALADFDPAKVPLLAAQAGNYALGLIAYREGREADAAKAWNLVQTPAAQFAAAIAQRDEFTSVALLTPEQQAAARSLNACVRLERGLAAKALELIDQHGDGRNAFLYLLAQILSAQGSPASVHALAVVNNNVESQRWQLYGHILAGRLDEAEALAKSLPAGDGYAMYCRIFIAGERHDPGGAALLFRSLPTLPGIPADYVQRLVAKLEIADYKEFVEPFNWPTGELLPTGWTSETQGTGIHIVADKDSGKLVFDGTQQEGAKDPVSRAGTLVPGARFHSARLSIDTSKDNAGLATVGLELLDSSRKNGIAIARIGGRANQHWRTLTNGRWSEWTELPYPVQAPVQIALDVSGGVIYAADPTDPIHRQRLSTVLARAQGDWWLGVFGTSDPNRPWSVGFDELRWRLKSEK